MNNINNYLSNKEFSEINDLLQNLIQIKSVTPPGNEIEIANYIKQYLLREKIPSELVSLEENRSSLIAEIEGQERRNITLCGHLDTVDVNEEDWNKPPFQGIVEDGKMYGRGASDMKSGVATIIYSMMLLKRKGVVPKKTIQLVLTADEEGGTLRGSKDLVDKGYFDKTDFLIITEPTNLRVAVGGRGKIWIKAKFYGESAHGSTPEFGVNTIIPGSKFIIELSNKYDKIFKEEPLWGKTSINIGQFHGGNQVNIVPDYSEIQLDFRVISEDDKERAKELIVKIGKEIGEKYKVKFAEEIFAQHPTISNCLSNEYISRFMLVSRFKDPITLRCCSDGNAIIPKKKIPFVIFGPGNLSEAHSSDEYVVLNNLYQSVETIVNFLLL